MPDPLPLKRPTSTEDLAAAIRTAADAGAQVQLTGSNSLPLTHFALDRPVQPISTLRLNKILHHAVSDMTVSVQAGITLEALQRHLAWQNQWLPIDPPVIARDGRTPGSRTIGGLIASNSLGPLRFASAGVNDWRLLILGMTWIDAHGTIIKGGGQTMKNVAGYSSPRLMIGSCGSLGAIAEVTLRTFARPEDERCLLFFCPDAAQAENLLASILLSPTTPAYVQAIGGRTFAANPLQLPSPAAEGSGLIVVAGFMGRPETCQVQVETLRQLPVARPLESIAQTAAQAGRLRLWMTSEPPLPSDSPAAIGYRIFAPSPHVAPLIATMEEYDSRTWVVAEAQGVLRGMTPTGKFPPLPNGAALLITQGPRIPAPLPDAQQRLKRSLDPKVVFGTSPNS